MPQMVGGAYTQPPDDIMKSLAAYGDQSESDEGEQDQSSADETQGGTNDEANEQTNEQANEQAAKGADKGVESKESKGSKGDESGTESGEQGEAGEDATVFEHEGQSFSAKALTQIIADHAEDENWKTANTKKAQSIAKQGKSIKEVRSLIDKISGDADAVELMKDLGYDLSPGGLKSLLEDSKGEVAEVQDKGPDDVTEGAGDESEKTADQRASNEQRLDELEGMAMFNEALGVFMSDKAHEKEYDTADKVTALIRFMNENSFIDFEESHKLFSAGTRADASEQRVEELEKEIVTLKGDEGPNAPVEGQGATDTHEAPDGPVHGDFGYDNARKKLSKLLGFAQ